MRVLAVAVAITSFACANEDRPGGARLPSTTTVDAAAAIVVEEGVAIDTTDTRVEDVLVVEDARVDDLGPPPDAAVFARCVSPYAAFPTGSLVAGGKTPKAFADAYNAEVASLAYPGPMLLVFTGVDRADASAWRLRVGALDVAGADVRFLGAPSEVAFRMSPGITLEVPEQTTSFKLRFDSPTTKTMLPIDGLGLVGAAADCSELSIDELVLIIPESAKNLSFAGKTVGELMGAPIAPDGGPRFFLLELLGSAKRATFAGGAP